MTSRLVNILSRSMIDLSALRASRDFRRLFFAQFVSQVGSQVTTVAIMYQVYVLTRSPLMVGLVGAAQIVPLVTFALVGGAIADAIDRRRLIVIVQVAMLAVSAALAVLALGHPPLWSIYVLAALGAGFAAVDGPARTAIIPMLVDDSTLRSAIQLREVLTQSGRVFGPVIGGALIAMVGLPAAYAVDATTFAVALATYVTLPPLVPLVRRTFELSSIVESLRFVASSRVLASTFIADLIAMVVGMPRAVFPALALTTFNVGAQGLGLLYAAPAAGALVGVLLGGGLTRRVKREGLAIIVSVALWGLCIAAFGLMPWFGAGLVLLAIAGAADMVSAVFRQTMLLALAPDHLRGRMGAVHIMVVTGGPPLGDIESGALANLIGIRPSVVLGGLACAAGALTLAGSVPQFTRWRGTSMEPAPQRAE